MKKIRLTKISKDEMKKATAGAEANDCRCYCHCDCWDEWDGVHIGEFDFADSGSFFLNAHNPPPIPAIPD